ncbi:S-layer homology domain-containing protein, partial [Bacillus songklensis]
MIDRALHQEHAATDEEKLAMIQTVDCNIKDEIKFTEQQDLTSQEVLYRETTTGYQLAYSLDNSDTSDLFEEFDGTFTM